MFILKNLLISYENILFKIMEKNIYIQICLCYNKIKIKINLKKHTKVSEFVIYRKNNVKFHRLVLVCCINSFINLVFNVQYTCYLSTSLSYILDEIYNDSYFKHVDKFCTFKGWTIFGALNQKNHIWNI